MSGRHFLARQLEHPHPEYRESPSRVEKRAGTGRFKEWIAEQAFVMFEFVELVSERRTAIRRERYEASLASSDPV